MGRRPSASDVPRPRPTTRSGRRPARGGRAPRGALPDGLPVGPLGRAAGGAAPEPLPHRGRRPRASSAETRHPPARGRPTEGSTVGRTPPRGGPGRCSRETSAPPAPCCSTCGTRGHRPPSSSQLVVPALRDVGEGWVRGQVSIAQEHRASRMVERLLGELTPTPPAAARQWSLRCPVTTTRSPPRWPPSRSATTAGGWSTSEPTCRPTSWCSSPSTPTPTSWCSPSPTPPCRGAERTRRRLDAAGIACIVGAPGRTLDQLKAEGTRHLSRIRAHRGAVGWWAMRILLTGATGFIGTEVARQLSDAGHPTRVMVRRPSRASLLTRYEVEPVYGDLLAVPSLERAVAGIDVVIHLGGSAPPSSRTHGCSRRSSEGPQRWRW